MNHYELLIRRRRGVVPPTPTGISFLPKWEPPTSITNTGFPRQPSTFYFIENGRLYHTTNLSTEGSATQVGTSSNWTCCTEYIERHTQTSSYDMCAYGICDGKFARLKVDGTASVYTNECNIVTGYYIKYKTSNNNEFFGLANRPNDGLYRVSLSTSTKINNKTDWVQLSGLVYNYNTSYYDQAFGIDSTGTLYRISYDGTLAQVATDITAVTGLQRNGGNWSNYGNATMLTGCKGSSNMYCLFIRNGALYYYNTAASIDNHGTLIDSTGTWTYIYGYASGTVSGYGIRNGHVCSIKTSGYTDTGYEGIAVGSNGIFVGTDGLVYTPQGKRLTTTTY